MSTYIWHGPTLVKQPSKYSSNDKGTRYTDLWYGDEASIDTLHDELSSSLSSSVQIDKDHVAGPVYSLTVTDVEIPEPKYEYELLYDRQNKDLLNSDKPCVKQLTQENKVLLIEYVNKPEKYLMAPPPFTGSVTDIDNAFVVYDLLSAGVKQVVQIYPVLRVQYELLEDDPMLNNSGSDNKILSTTGLILQEQVPTAIANSLPPSGDYESISGYATGSSAVDAVYGWLQYPATRIVTTPPKVVSQQEFHYGLWATDLYDEVI